MLGIRGHVELSHMEERLKMVLGPELYPLALELLTETAIAGILTSEAVSIIAKDYNLDGRSQSQGLREILTIAEHDGYLRRNEDGTYVFQSKLLKDWWAGRFGFGFQRTSERKGKS
jgi:hypothetical protein